MAVGDDGCVELTVGKVPVISLGAEQLEEEGQPLELRPESGVER